jgi:hypothetical protein
MSHSVPLCVAKDRIDRSGIVTNSILVGRWITKRGLITDAWWRGLFRSGPVGQRSGCKSEPLNHAAAPSSS